MWEPNPKCASMVAHLPNASPLPPYTQPEPNYWADVQINANFRGRRKIISQA